MREFEHWFHLISTGVRIRAIIGLKLEDLVTIPEYDLYQVMVYSDAKERYSTFTTREAANAIKVYLSYRERYGEKLSPFEAIGPLSSKTMALLIQPPPSLKIFEGLERLREMVSRLDTRFRYAVEVRHRSWFQDLAYNFFANTDLCLVWSSWIPPIVTTDFLYLRFIGDRSIQEKDFGRIQIDRALMSKGDTIPINVMGQRIDLVISTNPSGPVIINNSTKITVSEESAKAEQIAKEGPKPV